MKGLPCVIREGRGEREYSRQPCRAIVDGARSDIRKLEQIKAKDL